MSTPSENPSVPTQIVAEVKFKTVINNLGVIPTSYKDSMSYYENLAWLCKFLEETVIPTVNQNGAAVNELQGLYVELRDFVIHYWDNLDVQEEINNKINSMIANGTLIAMIEDYINPYIDQINEQIEAQNESISTQNERITVLNARVDNITSLPAGSTSGDAELIDIRTMFTGETLSSAGSSVRSQAEILNNSIINNEKLLYNKKSLGYSDFESGQISSTGVNTTFPTRFRTKNYIHVLKGSMIYTDGDVQFNICCFSGTNSSTLIDYRGFSANYYIVEQDCYIRFSINDGSSSEDFTEARVNAALSHMTLDLLESSKLTGMNNQITILYDDLLNNYSLSYGDFEQGQISSSGVNTTMPSRFRTKNYIKVLKGSSINTDGDVQFNIALFSDTNTDSLIDYRTFGTGIYNINSDCYIRFSIIDGSASEDFTEERVNTALSHMTLKLYYDKYIKETTNNNINKSIEIVNSFVPYNFSQEIVTYSTSNKLSTLYNLWDSLLSNYPDYITKEVLGTVTNENLEIRKYTISSNSETINGQQISKQKLVILYVGSMHGNEESISLDDYMMFKDMLDNYGTNESLKTLLDNVTFEVIPTINPYGYDHHLRNNENNVNINRNFNANWQYYADDDDYNSSGAYPESEPETQILCDYVRTNANNIFLVINRHSTASLTSGGVIGYFSSIFNGDLNIAYDTIRTLNSQMRSNFSWLKNEYTNSHNCYTLKKAGEFSGTFDEWYGGVMNLHGFLIELATTSGNSYSGSRDDMRKIAIDSVITLLQKIILKNKYICENDTKNLTVTVIPYIEENVSNDSDDSDES